MQIPLPGNEFASNFKFVFLLILSPSLHPQHWKKVTAALHTHTDSSQKSICLTKFSYTWRGKRVKTQEDENISAGVSELCHLNTRPPKKRFHRTVTLPPPCCKYAKLFRHQHQTWIGTHALTFPLYWFLSKVEKCQLSWLPNSLFLCFFWTSTRRWTGKGTP